MKTLRKHNLVFLGALIVMLATVVPVMAGGLVDTSRERFIGADFTNSQFITNSWWTLPADTNHLYFVESDGECEWNLVEVLNMTTNNFGGDYTGTNARIVLDREWVDEECDYEDWGALVEANPPPEEITYDWYAQDSKANIWYMGEDTWDGESNEGSFVAGCDGAEAGIVVLGDPDKGLFYQQEFYEDEAEDWGKVLNFFTQDGMTCMKTKEWTPLENGHVENKFYCSDDHTGELTMIHELKGKTVVVELIDRNVAAPPMPAGPPSPIPADCEE
jgi:hypothetical protein